jgi:hypothetical protein
VQKSANSFTLLSQERNEEDAKIREEISMQRMLSLKKRGRCKETGISLFKILIASQNKTAPSSQKKMNDEKSSQKKERHEERQAIKSEGIHRPFSFRLLIQPKNNSINSFQASSFSSGRLKCINFLYMYVFTIA